MDVDFACTACGDCCHDLRISLSVEEAIRWLDNGHAVEMLVDAVPWPDEPGEDDGIARYRKGISFPVLTGGLPSRVSVILCTAFTGACPHLREDKLCGNYANRPMTCQIYPAETHPFVNLQMAAKKCPPEAWQADKPPLLRGSRIVDAAVQDLIVRARQQHQADMGAKAHLCAMLGIRSAALINEGFAVYSPAPDALLAALRMVANVPLPVADAEGWSYVSNRSSTVEVLQRVQAPCVRVLSGEDGVGYRYLGFNPD